MSKKLTLSNEQKLVLETKGKDFLVAASAGSGKTFVVVERIIKRMLEDRIDIDKILVVTFTNAAAAELKERITNKIYDMLKDNQASKDERTYLKKQLLIINKANISTIHSFCLRILRSNFYNLGIDPGVKTLDENKAKMLLLESIDEILEQEYDEEAEMFFKVLELFKSEEIVIKNLQDLYSFSQSMIDPSEWLDNSLNQYEKLSNIEDLTEIEVGKELQSIINERIDLCCLQLEDVINKTSENIEFESRINILKQMLEQIEGFKYQKTYNQMFKYKGEMTSFPRLPSSRVQNEVLKNEISDVKKRVTSEIQNISKMLYKDTKGLIQDLKSVEEIIKWFVTTVKKIHEKYSEKKRTIGKIDFSDYEQLALKSLKNEETRRVYMDKFEEIYIDEYQDTSELQEEILRLISKNNLIMVGDVKQSIYSFRNAEPSIFNKKYKTFKTLEKPEENKDIEPVKIILSKNFRSRKEVLEPINYLFYKTMSEKVGGCDYNSPEFLIYSGGYDEHETANNNDYMAEINIIETGNDEVVQENTEELLEELSTIEKEAKLIANKIKQTYGSLEVFDMKKKESKPCDYKDIVVLMRSMQGRASIYEDILKKEGIPVFNDNVENIYSGEEIGLIISFLKVMDNYYDDLSLVSVLYSIIGEFTLDELVIIRAHNKKGYFYDSMLEAKEKILNADVNYKIVEKIHNFITLLNNVRKYIKTFSIAETIEYIYEVTGIYNSFYLEEFGHQKCSNLDLLIEVARKFEKEEKTTLYDFINYLENMKDKNVKGTDTAKLIGENENVVRLLTIHKSKGLEYPVVILAGASKSYNIQDSKNEILLDNKLGIGTEIFDENLGISYPSVIKQGIKEKIKERSISEEQRLLYTAMTRAKEKIIVFATTSNVAKLQEKVISSAGYKKLPSGLLKNNNNYIKNMLSAFDETSINLCKINYIKFDEEQGIIENVQDINKDKIKSRNKNNSKVEEFLKRCKNIKTTKKEGNKEYLFNQKYLYIDNQKIKKKYTVTELKDKQHIDDKGNINNQLIYQEIDYNNLKPKTLDDKKSAENYGTFIHKVMELYDYSKDNIDKTKEQIKNIFEQHFNKEIDKIESIESKVKLFLNSKIREYINQSVNIEREKAFVIY
ncbi:MAG: helicase-exonuclease AddAB subunit AddA, partial [Clostridia bacterium]|nr:helicase-exonuclease AddAB subunit AddA [Clostridia bacterium]